MAKTFDVSDPGQREDYLRESMAQVALYGSVHLEYGGGSVVRVLDQCDLIENSQDGFSLVMDDGRTLPFPRPSVSVVVP